MKASCVLLCVAWVAAAQDIEPGTHVLLTLEHSVSTRTAKPGTHVYLRTATPAPGIPVGSYVDGVVTAAKRGRAFRGGAKLDIRIASIQLPNGERIVVDSPASLLETEREAPRRSDPGAVVTPPLVGGTSGAVFGGATGARVGLAAGLAVAIVPVLTRAKDIELPRGAAIDATIGAPPATASSKRPALVRR